MRIGEILARTQKETLEEIAKQYLTIGKTAARQALKNAGCYCKRGTRGWHHDNLPQIAERSIYDFVPARKSKLKMDAGNENAVRNLMMKADSQINLQKKEEKQETADLQPTLKAASDLKKEVEKLDAIDRILFRKELERDLKTYKGFYWDADIIEFLDNVEHADQNDLMNEIVRSVLVKKGFL